MIFLLLFGFEPLNFANDAWLLNSNQDIKQHYVGWTYYRDSPWSFPEIGKISGLAYPSGLSVVYTDSVPLFAIFFKLISFALPATFQYFGLFELLCFALTGGLAALLISRWSKNIFLTLGLSLFFILSPMILHRVFGHTALSAHFIILLAIYFLVNRAKYQTLKSFCLRWGVVFLLSVSVHAYFLPMTGILFLIALILTHKTWRVSLLKFAVPLLATLLVAYLIGLFSLPNVSTGASDLGNYPLTLLGPFDPYAYSAFLKSMNHRSGEGLNYFGLGTIILLIICLFLFIKEHARLKLTTIKIKIKPHLTIKNLLVALTLITMIFLALSPQFTIGARTLFEVRLPNKLLSLWAIFRATGRLFWPVYYLCLALILRFILKHTANFRQFWKVLFFVPIIGIQIVDIVGSPAAIDRISGLRAEFTTTYSPTPIAAAIIENGCDKSHLIFLGSNGIELSYTWSLFDIAYNCNMTMNTGYFARLPEAAIRNLQNEEITAIKSSSADYANNFYILNREDLAEELRPYARVEQFGDLYVVKEAD